MEDKIINKLKRLGALIPDNEYLEASKKIVMMRNDESFDLPIERQIAEKIYSLREISPDPNYALASRMAIMESIRLSNQSFWKALRPENIFRNSINYTLSMGLAVVLFAVIVTGTYKFVSPVPIVADLDNKNLLKEADLIAKDIDIRLEEINLYKETAEKTAMALSEAYVNGPGHINNYIIQKEAHSLNFNDPQNNEIDELLQKAIF